ncbi:hypothetical protein [Hyphomonas sp.]|jgi:hypothetical protein|uniref:hypothetical protein n=1 Tax=Hyphomonas sp. TaxID=87 RepID=UPI0032D94D21
MRRLVTLLCAIFAISPFLSGAAHTRAHAEEPHHVMAINHHLDDLGLSHDNMPDLDNEYPHDLDHEDHPAELHFVALGLSSAIGVVGSVTPFERLVTGPPPYRGPIRLKDPDPERISD